MVMSSVQVGASHGEVGYQVSTIAKIDFPEPPQLKTTSALLSQGEPAKALAARLTQVLQLPTAEVCRIGEAAQMTAAEFSVENVASRYLEDFESLLGK